MITISLNNHPKTLSPNTSLSEALAEWEFSDGKIAVAINQEFVPRSTYRERILMNGDQIDIVKPVGGG
ncbi:MAG: sulfur carrier protein ThiS [Cellvibrio sp.]|nr:sulfur carrier protein ThiS [Cellvibrio sp.]